MRKNLIKNVKRAVIKVGTSTLTNEDGTLNENFIKSLVAQICKLFDSGVEIILVTSGAVGAGMGRLNLSQKPKNISQKQALAAVGQVALMHLYERIFWAYSRTIAQLLLTRSDFDDRKRYLNARNVCNALLSQGIIPIINENDPVVGEALQDMMKVGDNDTLSALVCGLSDADLLVILSDISGLCDKNPSLYKDAKLINLVEKIDDDIKSMAGDEGSKFGTGGMVTKIKAAQMATKLGSHLVIANGKESDVLLKILQGSDVGTLFLAEKKINSRKFWLEFGASKKGGIIIDDGATQALKNGKSLLSVGVKGVMGEFDRAEVVDIFDLNQKIVASGISNYSSKEIELIKGVKSDEISKILSQKLDDEIIHADNIAVK